MKRITAVILSLIILLSFQNIAFSEEEITVPSEAGLLVSLSVIEEGKNMDALLTRGELADMLAKASGLSGFSESGEQVFSDVTAENPYSKAIAAVKKMGYMSGYEDGTFRPEKNVTVSEAEAAVVNLLGYRPKANAYGGYPAGYGAVVRELKLRNGLEGAGAEALTLKDGVKLIYNALNTLTFKVISVEGDSFEYGIKEGETLLYDAFKIRTVKGKINGVDITTLMGESNLPPYSISVDDTVIYSGVFEVYSLIGCEVIAYYTDYYSRNFLRHIEKTDKNRETVINIADVSRAEGDFLTVTDKEGREKKYSFDMKSVIFNGVATDKRFSMELLAPKGKKLNGKIRLLDNDGNGRANLISVDAYEDIIAGRIDVSTYTVYDKNDYEKRICLDETSWQSAVKIYDGEGAEIKFASIKPGDVISVYASENSKGQRFIRAYASSEEIRGALEGYGSDEEGMTVTVNKKAYLLTAEGEKSFETLIPGREVILSLNASGLVAEVSYVSSDGRSWGLIKKAAPGNGFEAALKIKLVTASGATSVYEVAGRVTVDGREYNNEAAKVLERIADASALFAQGGENHHQVIKFGTDAEGRINYIDTVLDLEGNPMKQKDSEENDSLYMGLIELGVHSKEAGVLAFKRVVSNPATVFTYPAEDKNAADDNYYKVYGNGYFVTQAYRNLYWFGDSKDSLASAVFLQMLDKKSGLSSDIEKFGLAVIEKITDTVDAEGVKARKLYLDLEGKKVSVLADETAVHDNGGNAGAEYDYTHLSAGDIIYFTEANGKMEYFQVRYDKDKNIIPVPKGSANGFYKGHIYSVKNDGVKFITGGDLSLLEEKEENGEYKVFSPEKTGIIFISEKGGAVSARQGTASELAGYDFAGEECTPVLIQIYEKSDYNQQAKTVFVYE